MEVHAPLGATGRAGRERDQRDVVGRRGDGRIRGVGRRAAQEVVGGVAAVRRDPQSGNLGLRQVVDGPYVAQRVPDQCYVTHHRQLVRPLLGQHGDGDPARLQHGQPAGREPGRGRAAQQDAVAGEDAEVAGEDVREAVDVGAELAVRPGRAGGGVEHRAARVGVVQEFGGAVQPIGVTELRQVEPKFWPVFGRREVVAREGVDVGRDVHGGAPLAVLGVVVGSRVERIVLVTTVNGAR